MKSYIPHISNLLDGVIGGLDLLMPELILSGAFLLSIFCGILTRNNSKLTWWVTVIGISTSAVFSIFQFTMPSVDPIFFGMILPDAKGALLKLLIGFACLLFCIFIHYNQALKNHVKRTDDLLSVLLVVHIGLSLMATAVNWLMVYIAIETVSIGSYIMVGYMARDRKQSEAAMKYVLFGTMCSAIMLYGLSLFYGYTGSLCFVEPAHLIGLTKMPPLVFMVSILFVLTGIGFKLSFVPFHFWSPDVYQGAPTPVTAFISTAPKIAAIALLSRFIYAWPSMQATLPVEIFYLLAAVAIASMLLGNVVATRQDNVKRMMAYSSIGHTGFLIMISLTDFDRSFSVLFFYLAAYVMMNMGVFMTADYLEERLGLVNVSQYRGLGKVYPLLMVAMTILMMALIGLPPTIGFVAKLLAFSAVISTYQQAVSIMWLLLLATGAITTVIALFFYFRIPLNAFLREPKEHMSSLSYNGLAICACLLSLLSLLLGLYPSLLQLNS